MTDLKLNWTGRIGQTCGCVRRRIQFIKAATNFNALVTLPKQIISKDVRMASYLMHACPRCKYFLGVVVRESNVGEKARPIRAFAFVVDTNFLGN
jgi:hypothetical protein